MLFQFSTENLNKIPSKILNPKFKFEPSPNLNSFMLSNKLAPLADKSVAKNSQQISALSQDSNNHMLSQLTSLADSLAKNNEPIKSADQSNQVLSFSSTENENECKAKKKLDQSRRSYNFKSKKASSSLLEGGGSIDFNLSNGRYICFVKNCYYQYQPDEDKSKHINNHVQYADSEYQCTLCEYGCETEDAIEDHATTSHFDF